MTSIVPLDDGAELEWGDYVWPSPVRKLAEVAVPDDHVPGMRVPKGGSSCSTCSWHRPGNTCANEYFQAWHGSNQIPAPADEYCSDWYEPVPSAVSKIVRRQGDKWEVLTEDGSRVLGTHDNAREAYAQLAAIEHAKDARKAGPPDEARDDHGRWSEGGGSTGTEADRLAGEGRPAKLTTATTDQFPVIERQAGDFLVRQELTDAKFPTIMYDKLAGIRFQAGDYIMANAPGGKIVEAYGIYTPAHGQYADQIVLALNAPGGGNIAVFGGATVLHEVGHHVHIAKLTDAAADEWDKISEGASTARISSYARTNTGEHFAEAFRAYARGGDYRRKLKSLEPAAYKYMGSLWRDAKRYLPYGTHADPVKFHRRYFGSKAPTA